MTSSRSLTTTDEIDGDVFVHPVYLAGSRYTGDFALKPLFDRGFDGRHDDLGNYYLTAPDGRVRVGFIPEQEWDTLWKIAVYRNAFSAPQWGANFSDDTPTEIVTAVTAEIAQMYREDDDVWLDERPARASEWFAPYTTADWTPQLADRGATTLVSPDGLANVTHHLLPLGPEDAEQAGQDGRYYIGTTTRTGWYGRLSSATPARVLHAITAAMLATEPVVRYRGELTHFTEHQAAVAPIVPAPPSPLDVQRSLAAKTRSRQRIVPIAVPSTATRLAWTTATPGCPGQSARTRTSNSTPKR
ncbi:DUF317 domain-containing protein [Kitasatospora sp. NPDC048538]|uniref:DUF317 domain-containing protein n=1 Tax=Kitasatospora sp. NPDC048538 TaxID=3155633 RepID=UPI0033FD3AF7